MIKRLVFLLTFCLSFTSASVWASPELEKALLGRWHSENTTALDPEGNMIGGSIKIAAVDEYLGNNGSNTQGQVLMTFKYKNDNTVEASWYITCLLYTSDAADE